MSSSDVDVSESKKRKRNKLKDALKARKRAKISSKSSLSSTNPLKHSTSKSASSTSKSQFLALGELPWLEVSRPEEIGFEDDGMLMLEEIQGIEVVYDGGEEDVVSGRTVKFRMTNEKINAAQSGIPQEHALDESEEDGEDLDGVWAQARSLTNQSAPAPDEEPLEEDEPFDFTALPAWHTPTPTLHPALLRALHTQSFFTPTPIQAAALPRALAGRDVVGVAETGSGKTLAYGLPILHWLLSRPRQRRKRVLRALILAPTRELALQVSEHLNTCLASINTTNKPAQPPRVSVAAVVGGMSAQKQRRVIARGVDVLVCTPGRMWDLLSEDDALARQVRNLRFLVLDEADRMIETGHFAELENILRLTLRAEEEKNADETALSQPEPDSKSGADAELEDDEDPDGDIAMDDAPPETDTVTGETQMQTFVFSATLSKDLQRNLKRRVKKRVTKGKGEQRSSTLDDLVMRLDFRDPEPEVIDLSPIGGVVETLKQAKVECLSADKDVYLYYFLLRYPGRALVFLSAIDGIRRALPLLELLGLKAFPLHSQLEQKQRLKNLDRFKTTPNAILLATDIAARGLDIPAVDHVIHYQIPRTADTYVHRNGRTARAKREGFSLLMCSPDERKVVRALLGSLGRVEDDIPPIAIELDLLDKLKMRVQVARKIELAQHKVKKANHERNWLRETAEALELQLDSDFASDSDSDNPRSKRKGKHGHGTNRPKAKGQSAGGAGAEGATTAALKAELRQLLAQPLIARGVSARYITSGSRPVVEDLLKGQQHSSMLGMSKGVPGNDLLAVKKRKVKKPVQKGEEERENVKVEET